jgi:hypothetical protein
MKTFTLHVSTLEAETKVVQALAQIEGVEITTLTDESAVWSDLSKEEQEGLLAAFESTLAGRVTPLKEVELALRSRFG